MRLTTKIFFLVLLLVGSPVIASEPATGPVIDNYGPVFAVPQGSYNLLPDQQYKVVMDVGKGLVEALGKANVFAALECGIRKFDSSIAGLGGCPFAPAPG